METDLGDRLKHMVQGVRYQPISLTAPDHQVSVIGAALKGGAVTGGKAVVNGASGALVGLLTLGFVDYDGPLAVSDFERDVLSYNIAAGSARISGEIITGLATGGVSHLGKVGKVVLVVDAAGNLASVGRGAVSVYNEGGLTLENSVQLVGGGLGLGGNVAAAGKALKEVGVRAAETSSAFGRNPFVGKSAAEVDELLRSRGFRPVGPDPAAGRGSYFHPTTGRKYYLDPGGKYKAGTELPHVDVHRMQDGVNVEGLKKKFPLGDSLYE